MGSQDMLNILMTSMCLALTPSIGLVLFGNLVCVYLQSVPLIANDLESYWEKGSGLSRIWSQSQSDVNLADATLAWEQTIK